MSFGFRALVPATFLVVTLATACSSADADRPTSTVRDSAGVRIVENVAPALPTAPFTIDTTPLIDLGSASGGPSQEFSGFVHPVRLSDGRLVVANGGSQELRVFDSTGRAMKPIGRQGDGPGEFRSLAWLSVGAGDTLRTYDWSSRRVSVFTADGVFRRSMHMTAPAATIGLRPKGILGDGRLIFQTQNRVGTDSRAGALRDTVAILAYNASGDAHNAVGRYIGSDIWIERGENSVSVAPLPFGKELIILAHQSIIYIGTGDRPEVDVRAPDGKLALSIRWPAAPVAVTAADVDAYIAYSTRDWTPASESDRARYIASIRGAPIPKTKPAYAGFLVSSDGSLWVWNYNEPAYDAPPTYEVFDANGVWQGAVQMPARFYPTQITPDFVLGTWRDEDDVRHVRMHRIAARR